MRGDRGALRGGGTVLSQGRERGREEGERYRGKNEICGGAAVRMEERSRGKHTLSFWVEQRQRILSTRREVRSDAEQNRIPNIRLEGLSYYMSIHSMEVER